MLDYRLEAVLLLLLITAGVYWASVSGLLGPYGTPGDTYHLLILVAVLFTFFLVLLGILHRKSLA